MIIRRRTAADVDLRALEALNVDDLNLSCLPEVSDRNRITRVKETT
jgi:hypothetical protein